MRIDLTSMCINFLNIYRNNSNSLSNYTNQTSDTFNIASVTMSVDIDSAEVSC